LIWNVSSLKNNGHGGEKIMDKKVDVNERISEVKKAFSEFKENVHEFMKDLKVDVNDWKFSAEKHDDKVVIDVSVKLVLKHEETGDSEGPK
jgi:predicted transcriptional regulator